MDNDYVALALTTEPELDQVLSLQVKGCLIAAESKNVLLQSKQVEEVNEPTQDDSMFNVANVSLGEVLSTWGEDAPRQDVLQKKSDI